jgi:thiol-disulfide isomerase/thioredoxin
VPAAVGLAGVIVLILFFVRGRSSSVALPTGNQLATLVNEVTHVSPHVFDAVGTDSITNPLRPGDPSQPLTGAGGKPEVLYIGAEYCPYCASERWSLIAALSRFGDFQNLRATASASNDVFPNTPTFSFYQSHYSSQYLDFAAVETETREQQPLETPSGAQQALLTHFDPQQSIPFVDAGNRYVTIGSGYDTSLLTGLSWQDIASSLNDPNASTTKGIVANANFLTAAICQMTNQQPGSVCSSSGVTAAAKLLGSR